VQVSASVMVWVHRVLKVPITAGVLIAGGAAGVAAAFNTPLAGVAFAIEELAAAYEQRVALLVMAAVMISGLVMIGIAGDYVYFGVLRGGLDVRQTLLVAPVVGVVGGLIGGMFTRIVLGFTNARGGVAARIKQRPVLFAIACGIVVGVLGIVTGGTTWGTGYAPAKVLVEGGSLSVWFGPAKFLASLFTTLSGTPGGIFSPSLAVGAGLGNAMARLFDAPSSAVVLLGMAAYFVGVVRAPLTAVIILMETTASRSMILPLFATALIADAASSLVSRERIYHGLSKAFAAKISGDDEAAAGKGKDHR
jgi:H+/Cl- antiporter ClcA